MAVFVLWDGKLVNLRAEVAQSGADGKVDVILHPEPRLPTKDALVSFESVLKQLGVTPRRSAAGPASSGMDAPQQQLLDMLLKVWNLRGVADAEAVKDAFENVSKPTFEMVSHSILRRSR